MQKYMNRPYSARQRCAIDDQQTRNNNGQKHFYLSQKGVHQALRNKSDEIWTVMGHICNGFSPCLQCYSGKLTNPTLDISQINTKNEKQSYRIQRSEKQALKLQQNKQQKANNINNQQKSARSKNVSFSLNENENKVLLGKTVNISKILNKSPQKSANSVNKKKLTKQQQQAQKIKRQKFLQQCYSIDKYLKTSKAYTRQMPNSAIKLFYQKPCLQAYGRKNTTGNNGFIYNDFMKTHNVLPHRMGNQPQKYQTYRGAMNFCKRTKIDIEERWRKIHRQMKKRVNMDELVEHFAKGAIQVDENNLQQVLKLNINTFKGNQFKRSKSLENLQQLPHSQFFNATVNTTKPDKIDLNTTKATDDLRQNSTGRLSELKRSKSWGKKQYLFLYKYTNKDGQSHYCKDRHGITCYVDPSFRQNRQAYTKYLKKIKPIQAQDVLPCDRNIDQQLVNNFVKSKEQNVAKHYLLPNCDEPEKYRPQKYSWKNRRKSTAQPNNIQVSVNQ